jgi:hypothetical protein
MYTFILIRETFRLCLTLLRCLKQPKNSSAWQVHHQNHGCFYGRLTVEISKARVLAVIPLLSSLAENALVDVEEQKRYETFDFRSKNSAVLRWP